MTSLAEETTALSNKWGWMVEHSSLTSLHIPPEDRKRLEQLARDLGYIQTRGAGAGHLGNISALMRAIAQGQLQLVHVPDERARGTKLSEEPNNT